MEARWTIKFNDQYQKYKFKGLNEIYFPFVPDTVHGYTMSELKIALIAHVLHYSLWGTINN